MHANFSNHLVYWNTLNAPFQTHLLHCILLQNLILQKEKSLRSVQFIFRQGKNL